MEQLSVSISSRLAFTVFLRFGKSQNSCITLPFLQAQATYYTWDAQRATGLKVQAGEANQLYELGSR